MKSSVLCRRVPAQPNNDVSLPAYQGVPSAAVRWLGLGLLLLALLASAPAAAQVPQIPVEPSRVLKEQYRFRISGRLGSWAPPRDSVLALKAETRRAGEQMLDSLSGYRLYVPTACVGTRRCPLVVFFHPEGGDAAHVLVWQRRFADQYGMLLLAPTAQTHGRFDLLQYAENRLAGVSCNCPGFDPRVGDGVSLVPLGFWGPDVDVVQEVLRRVLREYAVDPDQIAFAGSSEGAAYAIYLGMQNPDWVRRIAVLSPAADFRGGQYAMLVELAKGNRLYLSTGMQEHPDYVQVALRTAEWARRVGYTVEAELRPSGHEETVDGYARLWQWLAASWALPTDGQRAGVQARTDQRKGKSGAAAAAADSLPLLTADALARLTTLWTTLGALPDSVWQSAAQAHARPVVVPVGSRQFVLPAEDLRTLAAKVRAVAAALKRAGLTAEQAAGYTRALVSAKVLRAADGAAGVPLPGSVQAQNQAALEGQQAALAALSTASKGRLPVAWRWPLRSAQPSAPVLSALPVLALPVVPFGTPGRLGVRPRVMATGRQTLRAGLQALDSLTQEQGQEQGIDVYVPPQCVGTRRCPLLVEILHKTFPKDWQNLADKYGVITFSFRPGTSASVELDSRNKFETRDSLDEGRIAMDPRSSGRAPRVVRRLDADTNLQALDEALSRALQQFAIDPEKIAIAGGSAGSGGASFYGTANADVFSRVMLMSPGGVYASAGPRSSTTQYFISVGLDAGGEDPHYWMWAVQAAQWARRQGYPVELQATLDGHGFEEGEEVEHHVYRWLQETWGLPGAPAPLTGGAEPDSVPVLTADALRRMVTFWTRFSQEPDSIRVTAFKRYRKRLTLPVGGERMTLTDMTDMAALAAAYPSVAAALSAAGLTARDEEAYAVALLSAHINQYVSIEAGVPVAGSTLARNLAFLSEHREEVFAIYVAAEKYLPISWD